MEPVEIFDDNQIQKFMKDYKHMKSMKMSAFEKEYCLKNKHVLSKLEEEMKCKIFYERSDQTNELMLTLIAGKREVLLKFGNILKEKGDALVNPVNRLFILDDKLAIAGVARAITEKAGEEFLKECKEIKQELESLSPGDCIVTGSGLLNNSFKKIFNTVVYPEKDEETDENVFKLMVKGVRKILYQAKINNVETLVVPLLYTGVYNFSPIRVFEMLMCLLEELVLTQDMHPLKKIIICENIKTKVDTLMEFLEQNQKEGDNFFVPKNQWSWFNDVEEFEPYDEDMNREIDKAYRQNYSSISISFPVSKKPGTHLFNLASMKMIDISLGEEYDLIKDISEVRWAYGHLKDDDIFNNDDGDGDGDDDKFEIEEVFHPKISEMIEFNFQSRVYEFDLFLKEYTIDFKKNIQTNKTTGFERELKRADYDDVKKNTLEIENLDKNKWAKKYKIIKCNSYDKNSITVLSNNEKCDIEFSERMLKIIQSDKRVIKREFEDKYIYANQAQKIGKLIKDGKILLAGTDENSLRKSSSFSVFGFKKPLKAFDKILDSIETKGLRREIYELSSDSVDWIKISDRVKNEYPDFKIKSLKKVCNDVVFKKYNCAWELFTYDTMTDSSSDPGDLLVKNLLWHGTSDTHPKEIYDKDGFLLNFANDGSWGRGIYFAESLEYSIEYAYNLGASRIVLLCEVMLGKSNLMEQNSSLKMPPVGYNSVSGKTSKGLIHVVYHAERAYPKFIVELEVKSNN